MQFDGYVPAAMYLTALMASVLLGRWLGRMPDKQLKVVVSLAGAVAVIALVGLALVVLPEPRT
ncbi:hypothetical protein ACRCPS_17390 [Pseudomonas aeruginosa]